ncbi:MAG: molybdopterin adenylyltransferase [Chloroflexota bacterium]|nr:molybdopterin adenylyltransferase [Chloroflexota bacterium]
MITIGIISISDRASEKIYEDQGIPSVINFFDNHFSSGLNKISIEKSILIPDNLDLIKEKIIEYVDEHKLNVIITTGGTGPSKKDLTPNATREVIEEELPGFGEYMRAESLKYSKNAILSRQLAGIRKDSIVLNLPGNPNSIWEILPNVIDQIIHFVEERNKD